MEGAPGLKHRRDSDQKPLEPGSYYRNDGFTEEHEPGNRTNKKQAKSSKRKLATEYRLRNVPKSAWNETDVQRDGRDQVEGGGVEDEHGRAVDCETSFDNSLYVPRETDNLERMVVGLERNIQLVADSLDQCSKTRDRARKLASSAHQEVERRKVFLMDAIDDYCMRLHESVDGQQSAFESKSEEAMERLAEVLTSMKKSFEMRSELNSKDSRTFKDQMLKWVTVWNESKHPSQLPALPVGLSPADETPIDYDILHRLFGVSKNDDADDDVTIDVTIESSAADGKHQTRKVDQRNRTVDAKLKYSLGGQRLQWTGAWNPPWIRPRVEGKNSSDASRKQLRPATLRIQKKIREGPELVLAFSCRLNKDRRTCGITDLALTDEGQVLVLDKNNKVIKMFDSQGALLKYFGKNDLRRPSRISRIRSSGQIAVTDEGSNRVLVFSEDGQFLSQLIALQHPVSHCQLTATRFAILEFSTRAVVICDLEGTIASTFPTHLDCPSYIASTPAGNIVVTDWKTESFKIFDSTGSERFSYCHSTSAESARHVVEPYGVCADDDGVVVVADRKKREVVFYSDDGTEVWSYDDAVNQIGVPFAVDCNRGGILAIGEYSGTVRLFRYKTKEDEEGEGTGDDRSYAALVEEHVRRQTLLASSDRLERLS